MRGKALPPLNWLRAFEASARHLSFTGAAHELNMTQSAVSQHIKNLEHFLGRALFIRRPRALLLTEDGFNYLPIVQDAFATLTAGTRALTGSDRGRILTVQSNLAWSTFWLAPRLPDLLAKHPWLTLNLVTPIWDPERTAPEAEVEIRFGRSLGTGVVSHRLNNDTSFPVCSPKLAREDISWSDTTLFDCSGILANWEAWLADQGERLPKDKMINLASTFVITLNAAAASAGFAMAHETLSGDLIARGVLVRPFEHAIDMADGYHLIPPARHAETPASRAFAGWVLEQFGNPPVTQTP